MMGADGQAGIGRARGLMTKLPDEMVYAIGHVTIMAGELELALTAIAASETRCNAFSVMAKPGEALREARRVVASMVSPYREAFAPAVEQAAELLARRHMIVHGLWINYTSDQAPNDWLLLHYKTAKHNPIAADDLEDLARRMQAVWTTLVEILTAQINREMPPTQSGFAQAPV